MPLLRVVVALDLNPARLEGGPIVPGYQRGRAVGDEGGVVGLGVASEVDHLEPQVVARAGEAHGLLAVAVVLLGGNGVGPHDDVTDGSAALPLEVHGVVGGGRCRIREVEEHVVVGTGVDAECVVGRSVVSHPSEEQEEVLIGGVVSETRGRLCVGAACAHVD